MITRVCRLVDTIFVCLRGQSHFSAYFAFVSLKLRFLGRKWDNSHENDVNVGEELPLDSRSGYRMFLFQSCYWVACPVAAT
jgi:hypothetical protein